MPRVRVLTVGLFKGGASREDRDAYKAARRELHELGERHRKAGIDYETEEYYAANDAVIEAEKKLPWWQR